MQTTHRQAACKNSGVSVEKTERSDVVRCSTQVKSAPRKPYLIAGAGGQTLVFTTLGPILLTKSLRTFELVGHAGPVYRKSHLTRFRRTLIPIGEQTQTDDLFINQPD